MAQETILISDGNGVNFQHRLRCNGDGDDSWDATVTDVNSYRDSVQDGDTNPSIQRWNNGNSGGGRYITDRNYFSFDMSVIPGDATITAVSVIFTTQTAARFITDADSEVFRLVKGTDTLDGVTAPNGTTTANAIDHTVNNGADVNGSSSDLTDITFDLGSSGLYDWVVSQHAAGEGAHMYLLTKLEYDTFVDETWGEPSGTNYSGWTGIAYATTNKRPRIVVDYTPGPPPPFNKLKVNAGQLKINAGTLVI